LKERSFEKVKVEGLVVVCWLRRRRGIGLFRYPPWTRTIFNR